MKNSTHIVILVCANDTSSLFAFVTACPVLFHLSKRFKTFITKKNFTSSLDKDIRSQVTLIKFVTLRGRTFSLS